MTSRIDITMANLFMSRYRFFEELVTAAVQSGKGRITSTDNSAPSPQSSPSGRGGRRSR
jgi:hypothetical protein